ncbi:hypothetical protein [Sphingopyxis sp. QXT-31]|uniref:hypothetical protein n=1 Tax=Sphingopyxis sp. QXT-31 TaxID=1357916 RepID=UPI0012EC6BDE|nr:hypothetical protein [Sphingopyxis sp. QXT-31]
MAKAPFTASKTRSSRPGWTITFRHPLKQDASGKLGRKVRRGLNTKDDDLADEMVEEMNEILGDRNWWNPVRRPEAEARFYAEVVAAFYDDLTPPDRSSLQLRDSLLPLPGKADGYSRVLFVGTTGAGKTTLLRQLIGSAPETDRFPSTAPAKTTIADIEVILAEGDYEAVVTFFPELQIQSLIEECVLDAAMAAHNGLHSKVAERLLNHRDQRFRLSYILGPHRAPGSSDADDDFSFDDDGDDASESFAGNFDEGDLPEDERARNVRDVEAFVARIEALAEQISSEVESIVTIGKESFEAKDREALDDLIEEAFEAVLHEQDDFGNLVHDILDAIAARFAMVAKGTLSGPSGKWPEYWTFSTGDRTEFISTIRWFSSNFWPHFGRLLTPVVDGIRVKGPLYPEMREDGTQLVLIDGQGLGHTPDYGASISTNITGRFDDADVILLVDNAQQPMQAAPLSVLRAVASQGHSDKLVVAFTHFDLIKGPSLSSPADRRAHVMSSVLSALARLREFVGSDVVNSIEHGLDDRCFMLGGTDRVLRDLPAKAARYMRGQLERMLSQFEAAAEAQADEPEGNLHYDPTGMILAVQDAVEKFHGPWLARLGISTFANYRREHWTRIKALTKRISTGADVEYDTLQPLADFHRHLQEAISLYLDSPEANQLEDDDRTKAVSRIRRLVASGLLALTRRRLIEDRMVDWTEAHAPRGSGSTWVRATRIAEIYRTAAPVPEAAMTSGARQLLGEIIETVTSSVEAVGGRMLGRP